MRLGTGGDTDCTLHLRGRQRLSEFSSTVYTTLVAVAGLGPDNQLKKLVSMVEVDGENYASSVVTVQIDGEAITEVVESPGVAVGDDGGVVTGAGDVTETEVGGEEVAQ